MGLREWWFAHRAKSLRKVESNAEQRGWWNTAAIAGYLATEQEEEAADARFEADDC
ncbi:MAG: hypothetical protein ACREBC_24825 [Pyrinomonadaceae bacterium]